MWYRCTIQHANANTGGWDVIFDDGDTAIDLCRSCVRPFIPYAINETLDIMLEPDGFVRCHVVAAYRTGTSNDMAYDVQLDDDNNKVIHNVATASLRRNYRLGRDNELSILPVGIRVSALYSDKNGTAVDYFPGHIMKFNANRKSYDVEFDDGDISNHIRRQDIQLMDNSDTMSLKSNDELALQNPA